MLYASGKGSVSGNVVLEEVCNAVKNINSSQAVWPVLRAVPPFLYNIQFPIPSYIIKNRKYQDVLCSGEVFTEYTVMAEQQTGRLTKIPIDVRITQAEENLQAGREACKDERMARRIRQLNHHVLHLLGGLIEFKKQILQEVTCCRLFTANYPLLIEHIIREAELYQKMIASLEDGTCKSVERMAETERFWNQIMMEHALFIRGLLDPTEGELIETADSFAGDYQRLLEEARQKDCRAMNGPTRKTLETTKKYRDFKAAGTKGITGCEIRSIILPLLADHVLREANHYLRLLKQKGE